MSGSGSHIYPVGERVLIPASRVLKGASAFTAIMTLAIACLTIIAICKVAGVSFPKKVDHYLSIYKTDPLYAFGSTAFLFITYAVLSILCYQTSKAVKRKFLLPKFDRTMVFSKEQGAFIAPKLKPGQFCYIDHSRDDQNRESDQITIVFGRDLLNNPALNISCSSGRIAQSDLMNKIRLDEATELVVPPKEVVANLSV